jgi:hypothetical protein
MQPREALSASAQVAVTLAGFAGVVVAFRTRSVHEWSRIDKFRLRILLTNSATPFMLSMLAMVLSSTTLDQQRLWQVCSILAFVVIVIVGQQISGNLRSLSREEFQRGGGSRALFYSGSVIATATTLLQIYNAISLKTFWPFFSVIATQLALGMLQFVLLVVAGHESESAN